MKRTCFCFLEAKFVYLTFDIHLKRKEQIKFKMKLNIPPVVL